MEETHEDTIKQFKLKVEEAINLLPQIPEAHRGEVWTYWQVISVAVKAAAGGRGPIVAKQTALAGKRPRGRPCLHVEESGQPTESCREKQSNQKSISIHERKRSKTVQKRQVKHENIGECGIGLHLSHQQADNLKETTKVDKVSKAPDYRTEFSKASLKSCSTSTNHTIPAVSVHTCSTESLLTLTSASSSRKAKSVVLDPKDISTAKEYQNDSNMQMSDAVKIKQNQTQDTCNVSNVSQNKNVNVCQPLADSGDKMVVKPDQSSVPVGTSTNCVNHPSGETEPRTEISEANKKQSGDQVSDVIASSLSTDMLSESSLSTITTVTKVPGNSTVSAKRKRGRPRRNIVKQLQECHDSASTSDNLSADPSLAIEANISSQRSESVTSSINIAQTALKVKPIKTALNLEIKKNKVSYKKSSTTESSGNDHSSTKVRRSVRRVIPKKDNIFSYFPTSQTMKPEEEEGKEEEEKEEDGYESDDKAGSVKTDQTSVDEAGNKMPESDDRKPKDKEAKMKSRLLKLEERTCPTCHVVLLSASSLRAHMRIHTGERPFECPVCHRTFTTKGNCERHKATHVGLKAFACSQCNKKFTEKKSLKIHMRGHTGERPYECKICGMRFFQSGTLKSHMDRHTGRKGHLCDLCGKAFRQSCQLRVHMRRHTSQMPYNCQYCHRLFYTKSDMERHALKHTGERPFSCDQCSKTFTRLQYLREHQNTHLGRRPYKCVVCGLAFHDFSACHRHVNKHKIPDSGQPVEQIHVEVTPDTTSQQVLEHVQVILEQQNQTHQLQTFIIPDHSPHLTVPAASTSSSDHLPQPTAHSILSSLMEAEESSDIYHVTLVDPAQDIAVADSQKTVAVSGSDADFSAINLLANATTQLSADP